MLLPFFKKRVSDPDFVFPCNKVHVFHSLFVQFKRFSFFFSRFEIPGTRKEDPLLFSIRLLHSSPAEQLFPLIRFLGRSVQ